MLYDFIIINKNDKTPLYRQIYMSVRKSIETGSLKKGTKLPSIRRLSADLDVSKTTVNGAYEQLCAEGYISNKPQSGYYVEAQFSDTPSKADKASSAANKSKKYYEYDFSSKSIDDGIININEWKKYVKEVLNQNYLLTSYGEEQGEEILRNALQKYSLGTRSVNTSYENIIVGAGTQTLLHILCSLLGNNEKIALADYSYIQSEYVFNSHGYDIKYFRCDKYGACIDSLEEINPDIILLNPNFTVNSNITMPVTRRLEIIKWAKENNALIIEDDYNSEFRYYNRPTPSLQGLSGGRGVVYLGTFSRLLLPSIRMSYMVLPPDLLKRYQERGRFYNQTASKAEQIALCQFIRDGHLESQIRKSKKLYAAKAKCLCDAVRRIFGEKARTHLGDAGFLVLMELDSPLTSAEIAGRAAQAGVAVRPVESVGSLLEKQEHHFQEGYPKLLLSCASMGAERYEEALEVLKEVVYKKEK